MRFIIDSILNNFWAKVITLVFAVSTWFYVFDLVNDDSFSQKKESVEDVFSRYAFTTKKVPIEPVFYGVSPMGYKVDFSKVKVVPDNMTIFGPAEIVDRINGLKTDKINLGEYTKSIKLSLGIKTGTKFFHISDKIVDVYIPVEPLKIPKQTS